MINLFDKLCAVDIETGGIDVGVPVIEVAFGNVFSSDLDVLWNMDVREKDCTEQALYVNRCFEADRYHHPKECRLPELMFAHVIHFYLQDKVLIGANIDFDVRHLEALLKRYGLKRSWSYRTINLSSLVAGWTYGKGIGRDMPNSGWSQRDAAKLVGIDPVISEVAHTAPGDVENVKLIARKVFTQ